jgi:hypothetical protein
LESRIHAVGRPAFTRSGVASDYKFKRYEDASLAYTGINRHEGEDIGLYDTVLTGQDAHRVFENLPQTY